MSMKKKKLKLKKIGYEELNFVIEWNCPYCKSENIEPGDFCGEDEILTCRKCKKDCQVEEPD